MVVEWLWAESMEHGVESMEQRVWCMVLRENSIGKPALAHQFNNTLAHQLTIV
jgi:hypothetical protein